MNRQCLNHLNYADDCVLLAPSPKALQQLITCCEEFAKTQDMIYNRKKSVCMSFMPKAMKNISIPRVFLNQECLQWVTSYKYLGVCISDDMSDDADMARQIKSFYIRGNTLVRKFRKCSDDVKVLLFKTYCSNIYAGHLWQNYSNISYRRTYVAYNNIFRSLFNIQRGESISRFYVTYDVPCFKQLLRSSMFGFYKRLMSSSNTLLTTVISSNYFLSMSKLFEKWRQCLFNF